MINLKKGGCWLIIKLLFVIAANSAIGQTQDIVSIQLKENQSDAVRIKGRVISKARVYGTKDDILHFLINDAYVKHYRKQGVIYHFFKQNNADTSSLSLHDYEMAIHDSNGVMVLIPKTEEFREIMRLLNPQKKSAVLHNTYKLGKINELNVYISGVSPDSVIIPSHRDIVSIQLDQKKHTDVLNIKGRAVSKAIIYGTKDNIMRFLVNDQYIDHGVESGVSYNFTKRQKLPALNNYFDKADTTTKRVVLVIPDKKEFLTAYRRYTNQPNAGIPDSLYFDLKKENNVAVRVYYSQTE